MNFTYSQGYEKPAFQERQDFVSDQQYEQTSYNPWLPGWLYRMPWLAVLALLGALIGVAAAIVVLLYSDGKEIDSWNVQPTVYLAIAATATNILLHFALVRGVEGRWWRTAMDKKTTIGDLHRAWSFGNSVWAALSSTKYFNIVAAATILVTISPLNAPLLQRASTVGFETITTTKQLALYIAPLIPYGYTGYLSGREEACSLLMPDFKDVVDKFNVLDPINITSTACSGVCSTYARGAGFQVECVGGYVPYNLTPRFYPNGSITPTTFTGTKVFSSSFSWLLQTPQEMQLRVWYKPTSAVQGRLITRNCTLQHATVVYPVTITNQTTISLAANTSMLDDVVIDVDRNNSAGAYGPSTLAGVARVLDNLFASGASVRWAGSIGYEVITAGTTAMTYATLPMKESDLSLEYKISFTDPTDRILATTRELMFRTAVHAAKWSNVQHVTALDVDEAPVYKSNQLYLWLGAGLSLLGILVTIPLFNRYWVFGRTISMSPIATSQAFSAPFLRDTDANADIGELIKVVGPQAIRYGATDGTESTTYNHGDQNSGGGVHLRMDIPARVSTPQLGVRYSS